MQVLEVLGEGASANTAQQSITGTQYTYTDHPCLSLVDRLMTPARVLSARVDTDSGAGAPHTSDTPALC